MYIAKQQQLCTILMYYIALCNVRYIISGFLWCSPSSQISSFYAHPELLKLSQLPGSTKDF